MAVTAKLTSKGQISLPSKIRRGLATDIFEVTMEGNCIVLRPVQSVAGALRQYGKGSSDFRDVREKVWEEVVNEKKGR